MPSLFLVNLLCTFLDVAASVESTINEEAARVKIVAVDILIVPVSDYSSKRVSSFFYIYYYVFTQVF